MGTRVASRQGRPSGLRSQSRYERGWSTVALVAAAVWIAVAILETPILPLLGVTVGLAGYGGIFFVKARVSPAQRTHQYLTGALGVAGLVLVIIGFRHHLEAGLVTVALLAGSSPSVLRWIANS